MFNQIKTSAKNKEVVTVLTRKFGRECKLNCVKLQ